MNQRAWTFVACLLSVLYGAAQAARAQEPLYTGAFADGTTFTAARVSEWHDTGAQPKVNGAWLFDPNRPVRWLMNQTPEPVTVPRAFIEFFGGDQLPCQVVDFHQGARPREARLQPHLVVRPEVTVDLPTGTARDSVRIDVESIRKVVWHRRASNQYTPSTLYFVDGRSLSFHSVKWTPGGVALLLKDGTRRVTFNEIAELHLPRRDGWTCYFEALALLTPDCSSRLMQCETYGGLIATVSLARFQARPVSGDVNGWYHLLQPAWSLDPLWVRHPQILWRRFFAPHEFPLSSAEALRTVERASLGGSWNWQVNRSVQGESLRSGGKTFGWGLGMHAYCELEFALPACAKSFHTRLGLDEIAGRGGCARALVYLQHTSAPAAFQSKPLVGSAEVVDSGILPLVGPAGVAKTLVLVADPINADRPAGADPLDIRDMLDWLEPQIEFDLEKLRVEVSDRWVKKPAAWAGWKPELRAGSKLVIANRWDASTPTDLHYRLETVAAGPGMTLTRELRLAPRQNFLQLAVARFPDAPPSRVEVRLDNQLAADFEVPPRKPGVEFEPLLVPVEKFHAEKLQSRPLKIEIAHIATNDKAFVEWQSLDFAEYATPTPWQTLEPVDAKTASESKLTSLPDKSLLATGKLPDLETYTITAHTELQGIRGVRLEVLPDASFPAGGPGRASNGNFALSDFRVTAAPRDKPGEAQPVAFELAAADFQEGAVAGAIDANPQTGWSIAGGQNNPHLVCFTTKQEVGFPGGTLLTFVLDQKMHAQHSIGRLRLSVTNVAPPIAVEKPTPILTPPPAKPLVVFEDQNEFIAAMNQGPGPMALDPADKFAGVAGAKLTGDRFNQSLPGLSAKIRQFPAPGEYRFVQFAWKKTEGTPICLQIAHDNQWGPIATAPKQFRYHAGPGAEPQGASLSVDGKLPSEWTLVTRDLFADFGEFTLTGLGFALGDAKPAGFDHILLGRTPQDFEQPKGTGG